jgi:hypothetical protein
MTWEDPVSYGTPGLGRITSYAKVCLSLEGSLLREKSSFPRRYKHNESMSF